MPAGYNITDMCKEVQTSDLHKTVPEENAQWYLPTTLSLQP